MGMALNRKGDLAGAIGAHQRAIAAKPDYAEAHCNLGRLLLSQGKFIESLAALEGGHELGSKQNGWRYPSAQWVKEAKRLVELDRKLPAILSGQEQPTHAAEYIEYVEACRYKRQYATAVRLYREAFAAKPPLAGDMRAWHRCNAACYAAQASTSQGEDAGSLDEVQRAHLRKQALDWLCADLAAWTNLLDSGNSDARALVQKNLQHWQRDPDLAALRQEEGRTR
jgi:hypothetical protein